MAANIDMGMATIAADLGRQAMVRERSTSGGMLTYPCFGLALVAGFFIVGGYLAMDWMQLAERLDVYVRTIERELDLVRRFWSQSVE